MRIGYGRHRHQNYEQKEATRLENEAMSLNEASLRPSGFEYSGGGPRHGQLATLYENYNEAPLFDHWDGYAIHYERHFPRPCTSKKGLQCEPIKMLEIGVQSGGSTRVWKKYYGDQLHYVGIDINPKCKRSESLDENIFIKIGSQTDAAFIHKICQKHGPFDVVIDDGGHTFNMINATLHTIFPSNTCMRTHSVYAIEDLHTQLMCDLTLPQSEQPYCQNSNQFAHLLTQLYYSMFYYWSSHSHTGAHQNSERPPHPVWGKHVLGLHFYDSLLFIIRGESRPLVRIQRGYDRIPYS